MFDFVLCEGQYLLVDLPIKLEMGWCSDLLEVEYDSSFVRARDISPSFLPPA